MKHPINIRSASVSATMEAIGDSLRKQIKAWGKQADFEEFSGIPHNTLHRLLRGEPVGFDVFVKACRSLRRFDLLDMMCAQPDASPLAEAKNIKSVRSKKITISRPLFSGEGLAGVVSVTSSSRYDKGSK